MANFDKLVEGQILHDYHKEKAGNTRMSRVGHWTVRIISINKENRTATCSWNGNSPRTWSERRIKKLLVNPRK